MNCEKSKQYQDTSTKIKQTLENDRSRLKLLEPSIEPAPSNWLTTIPLIDVFILIRRFGTELAFAMTYHKSIYHQ